jgi:SAM-dependent methyltransferase
VWNGSFAETRFPSDSFDAITLWNVLEHVEDPVDELTRAHGLLKPRGVLALSVPNLQSWDARAFGIYWIGWDVPRHLHLFPLPLLQTVLARVGFEVLDLRCIAGSHFTVGLSLQNWVHTWPASRRGAGEAGLRFFHSLPVRGALSPWWWLLDHARASGVITVLAQKVG